MKLFHQIWHGDSRELVKKFKPGRIDCLITDPPFGVNNQSNVSVTEEGKKYARKIAGDDTPANAWNLFESVFTALEPALSETADVYIFTSYQVLSMWLDCADRLLSEHKYTRKAVLVWQKSGPGIGDLNSPWGMGCEFILFYQRGREKTAPRRNNVLSFQQVPPAKLIHPHEKPAALLDILIRTSTSPGQFLVDPFAGSGSLVRAAKAAGRSAVGIEEDEYNYKLAKKALDDQGDSLF